MTRSFSLPRRTLDYLANGAPEGTRNEELLQAAIQYRDAGGSHGEAERDLIPRAEADGLCTAEARATIASAYRRPARSGISGRSSYSPVQPYGPKKCIQPQARTTPRTWPTARLCLDDSNRSCPRACHVRLPFQVLR